VSLSISLLGITLTNLAEIADVNFPSAIETFPCAESEGGKCKDLPAPSDYPNGYPDTIFPDQQTDTQKFAFGDSVTISGQTVSGITLTNTTGVNLDTSLYEGFKKISFLGVPCQGVGETIAVAGIPFAFGASVDETVTFGLISGGLVGPTGLRPCQAVPFTAQTVFNVTTVLGTFTSDFVISLPSASLFNAAELSFATGPLSVTQEFDDTLAALDTQATLNVLLNPDSNPAAFTLTATVCQKVGVGFFSGFSCTGQGLSRIATRLEVVRSALTLTVNSALMGLGTMTLSELEFVVSATAGVVNMGADITIFPTWNGVFTLGASL